MFSVPPQSFASRSSPVARRQASLMGQRSPTMPPAAFQRRWLLVFASLHASRPGWRPICLTGFQAEPVMTTKLAAPGAAMEAKGQHPSGAFGALSRAVISIPHRSPLCAASSLPESLRALASPVMPLNPPAKRNPTDRQCPALASSLPFIGRELAGLRIIPGGCGCKSPGPRSSSLPERRN
jgi:hypothetical protein